MAAVATPPAALVLDGAPHSDSALSSSTKPSDVLTNDHTNISVNGSATTAVPEEIPTSDALPSEAKLLEASKLPVWAADGSEHTFNSLFDKSGTHMIIFIRHFLCGVSAFSQILPNLSSY